MFILPELVPIYAEPRKIMLDIAHGTWLAGYYSTLLLNKNITLRWLDRSCVNMSNTIRNVKILYNTWSGLSEKFTNYQINKEFLNLFLFFNIVKRCSNFRNEIIVDIFLSKTGDRMHAITFLLLKIYVLQSTA